MHRRITQIAKLGNYPISLSGPAPFPPRLRLSSVAAFGKGDALALRHDPMGVPWRSQPTHTPSPARPPREGRGPAPGDMPSPSQMHTPSRTWSSNVAVLT